MTITNFPFATFDEFTSALDRADISLLPAVTTVVDWGGQTPAHGNRNKGTKGGIGSPLYKRTYTHYDIFNGYTESMEMGYFNSYVQSYYLKFRAMGLSHDQAMVGSYKIDDCEGVTSAYDAMKDYTTFS